MISIQEFPAIFLVNSVMLCVLEQIYGDTRNLVMEERVKGQAIEHVFARMKHDAVTAARKSTDKTVW